MRTSFDIAHSLLDVDKEKTLALSPRTKLFGFILAIMNLFPSGLSETFLANDATGYYLSLFLFIHAAVYTLFAFSYFLGSNQEILLKAKIFPTSSTGRILFIIGSVIKHPLSIALIASNSLFFMILYRHIMITGLAAIILYCCLMLTILVLGSIVFLFLDRMRTSASIALLFVILFTVTGLATVLVFDGESMMTFIPLVSSCVRGIQSARAFDYAGFIQSFVILAFTSAMVFFLGKRFV